MYCPRRIHESYLCTKFKVAYTKWKLKRELNRLSKDEKPAKNIENLSLNTTNRSKWQKKLGKNTHKQNKAKLASDENLQGGNKAKNT